MSGTTTLVRVKLYSDNSDSALQALRNGAQSIQAILNVDLRTVVKDLSKPPEEFNPIKVAVVGRPNKSGRSILAWVQNGRYICEACGHESDSLSKHDKHVKEAHRRE